MKTIFILVENGTGNIMNVAYNTRPEAETRQAQLESVDDYSSYEILELKIAQ